MVLDIYALDEWVDLGIWLTRKIYQQSSGSVSVTSVLGKGSERTKVTHSPSYRPPVHHFFAGQARNSASPLEQGPFYTYA